MRIGVIHREPHASVDLVPYEEGYIEKEKKGGMHTWPGIDWLHQCRKAWERPPWSDMNVDRLWILKQQPPSGGSI